MSAPVSLSFSSLRTFISFSLLCVSSVETLSDLWPMSKSLVIFVEVLNVAPQAPYQRHTKNSWEQLNMGFNSSLTTEVKIIAQCFQMEAASKELFSYHKLSASPACIPKLNLCRCGTIGTYDKHIYSASQTRPMWNSKAFFFNMFLFFIAGIDSWINMYCLWDFVVVYWRSSAEQAIIYAITGICLVPVTGKLSFSGNLFHFSF